MTTIKKNISPVLSKGILIFIVLTIISTYNNNVIPGKDFGYPFIFIQPDNGQGYETITSFSFLSMLGNLCIAILISYAFNMLSSSIKQLGDRAVTK